MPQMREDLSHVHSGFAVGRQRLDRHVRVFGDQPDEFCPSVAGGA